MNLHVRGRRWPHHYVKPAYNFSSERMFVSVDPGLRRLRWVHGLFFFVRNETHTPFLPREGSTLSAPYSAGESPSPRFHFVSKLSRNLRGTFRRVLDQFSSSRTAPSRPELERQVWPSGEQGALVLSSPPNSSGMIRSVNRRNASL